MYLCKFHGLNSSNGLDISKPQRDLEKRGQGHQNLTNSFHLPINVSIQVRSKAIQWLRR